MNPPDYFGYRTNEDPQEFVDEVYKILCPMGVNEKEKVAYLVNYLAQVWYKMLVDGRAPGEVPITCDILKTTFLEKIFPIESREDKVEDFINLWQEGISVKEYSLHYINLSKYVFSLVSNYRNEMRRFVSSVLEDLEKECG